MGRANALVTERGPMIIVRFCERALSDIVEPDLTARDGIERFSLYLGLSIDPKDLELRNAESGLALDPHVPIAEQISDQAHLEIAYR